MPIGCAQRLPACMQISLSLHSAQKDALLGAISPQLSYVYAQQAQHVQHARRQLLLHAVLLLYNAAWCAASYWPGYFLPDMK